MLTRKVLLVPARSASVRSLPSCLPLLHARFATTTSLRQCRKIDCRIPQPSAAARYGTCRSYASGARNPFADQKIEEITEQYSTAKDEFEIAVEETEKNSVYAADDRAAAASELAKLKTMFGKAVSEAPSGDVAAEIQRRAGQRIRELEEAVKGLEESAREGS